MVEIAIDMKQKQVHEVDVLRGLEVIKRHSGKNGSICFVVRRPGKSAPTFAIQFAIQFVAAYLTRAWLSQDDTSAANRR
jgi:hypothetical protein